MPCGWEGNRRSGVALAMGVTDNTVVYYHLRAHGLIGREMSTETQHKLQEEYGTLYLFFTLPVFMPTPMNIEGPSSTR